MNKHLSENDVEFYQRTDEVLHYLWDPIGVAGIPQARDEYDAYFPHVFSMLKQGLDRSAISDYLVSIEHDHMGLTISDRSRERTLEIADILIDHKQCIEERVMR